MKTPLTQAEFYALPEVQAQQEIQKRNPHGSTAHRQAWETICALAVQHGGPSKVYNPSDY